MKIYLPTFLEDAPYVELSSQPDDTGLDGGRRSHHRNAARQDHEQGYSWVAESEWDLEYYVRFQTYHQTFPEDSDTLKIFYLRREALTGM